MKDSTAAIEREVPVIDDAEPTGPLMMTKVDPAAELAKFDAAAQLLAKLVPATIKATKPQDWIKMGDKVYLQSTGLERIAPLWGLGFSEPKIVREDYPDGSFGYGVSGWVRSRFGVSHHVGGRSSADPFFDSFDEEKPTGWGDMEPTARAEWKAKHRVHPDPMDVRKAAVTNWMVRAGSMICGLRGLTLADLQAQKIDGVTEVAFGKGQKGGDAAPADLKARRTNLWNDITRRTGGDLAAARDLLKEVTKYDAYTKNDGTQLKAFGGATNVDNLSDRAMNVVEQKLKEHPMFGDKKATREPGEEG